LHVTYADSDFKMYHDLIWRYVGEAKKEDVGAAAREPKR
jgi:hypothetical protein